MTGTTGPRALWSRLEADRLTLLALGLLVGVALVALLAPLLPLSDPNQTRLASRLLPPLSEGHLLGTDQLGRDMLARLVFGARLSLWVALVGVSVAALLGSTLGLVAGYAAGAVDGVLMRLIDVLMAFPYLLLALSIVAVLGPGLANATLAIAIVNIPFFARTVRAHTLALRRETFVDAARVAGLGSVRILCSELLPALLPTIVVTASTTSGWMILETAGLSFLGLGAQPPTADLGGMLGQGRHLLATAPHVSLIPGAFIFLVVALFNLAGDGLRDALDPRGAAAKPRRGTPAPAEETQQPLAEPAPAALLSVSDLYVGFGDFCAVAGVSFQISRGEKLGLVGESGSGKSVTAHAVLRLLEPPGRVSRGSIHFDGRDVRGLDRHALSEFCGGRIAWVPQDPMTSLHPLLRIEQQLLESLALHRGLAGKRARRVALELLEEVGIVDPESRLDAWPHQLSGGMRQRVVIAMALAGSPELLIADEPTTALDVTTQAALIERLDELCASRNMALWFISHDLSLVSQLCDRVLVMHQGSIVESGPVGDVIERPTHSYTRALVRAVPELGHPERILGADAWRTP